MVMVHVHHTHVLLLLLLVVVVVKVFNTDITTGGCKIVSSGRGVNGK
jgi:hypothetical protein